MTNDAFWEFERRGWGSAAVITAGGQPFIALGRSIGVPGPPVWSPDGRKIAVARQHRGTYVMNADGSHLTRLTTATGSLEGARFSQQPLSWRPLVSVLIGSASKRSNRASN